MGIPTDPYTAVRRALLSVSDPTGLAGLAKELVRLETELIATEGTRTKLLAEGIEARAAEDLTGVGAWFGGRIKTLHPGLLGGILAPRTREGLSELDQRHLLPIDLVVCNLYPFAAHVQRTSNASDREEFIDVGGVTLLRAAAKNHAYVAVASDPTDYPGIERELRLHQGLSGSTRLALARRAFSRTAEYDHTIAEALSGEGEHPPEFPARLEFTREAWPLRYGENPHQSAAIYRLTGSRASRLPAPDTRPRKGEALSYTNLLDLETARAIVSEFPTPTAAVVKHATPCGVASGATSSEAIARAIATDPVARYGCVIAVNHPIAGSDPEALKGVFVDLIGAPSFDAESLALLERRPKLKVVELGIRDLGVPFWEARTALGRLLVQEGDRRQLLPTEFRPVTGTLATPHEASALDFAWRVVRHARSNAIVLAQGSKTVGIGSGQPTRVKAVELACEVAGERARGAVLASDAFFPFADGIERAGAAGVKAIIQPGGSLRDPEVIAAAERYGMAMYFTGWRVFRH
ncbi:MAG: bifunctional phosphoribosylaminoimidazolecarboxamide formyltransferase/IMP cyclohydrolase [Thermoplasmata archaeon]|nr:bifunctional phosphoribosylaminoimidazolecarboxamide formyltransferase/IMP cyclohydrolase [Thermoplasmata archaeon]MCI4359579.1 bifunctional phosphoribosylaminoimidazolecarboxamide formyltransferase/IMP cyclohydrolase [Thermoplasmata archaeon]